MVEAAERGDFAAARAIHARILPLMQVNFVESNPVPVKAAMAAMGLLEESYRLPMVPPRPESKEKILERAEGARICSRPRSSEAYAMTLESEITQLVAAGASADRDAARAAFAQLREALSAGHGARRRAGRLDARSAGASTPG